MELDKILDQTGRYLLALKLIVDVFYPSFLLYQLRMHTSLRITEFLFERKYSTETIEKKLLQ